MPKMPVHIELVLAIYLHCVCMCEIESIVHIIYTGEKPILIDIGIKSIYIYIRASSHNDVYAKCKNNMLVIVFGS